MNVSQNTYYWFYIISISIFCKYYDKFLKSFANCLILSGFNPKLSQKINVDSVIFVGDYFISIIRVFS